MNEKDFKRALAESFSAPEPQKKAAFLQRISRFTGRSRRNIILSQGTYIHKGVWAFSALVFLAAVLFARREPEDAMFLVSLLMPFVAGVGVFATFRSFLYRMNEMEGACLLSFRGILFARFFLIAVSHAVLIILLTVFLYLFGTEGFLLTGSLILIPYLLTSFLCLELERTGAGRERPWLCFAVASGIGILSLIFEYQVSLNLTGAVKTGVFIAAVLLLLVNIREYISFYKAREEVWNFV